VYKFAPAEAAGQGEGRLITLCISTLFLLRIPRTQPLRARPLIGMQGSALPVFCLQTVAHIARKTKQKGRSPGQLIAMQTGAAWHRPWI